MTDPPQDSEDPEAKRTDGPDDGDPTTSRMGGAPVLVGGAQMRAQVAAALFGEDAPKDELDGEAATLVAMDGRAARKADLEESAIEDRLGRFRVLERLGRGGMGVVYSAYDPQLDRKVAVKLLRPDVHHGLGAEAATARLLREAQAMAKISDPHVIVVHEVGMLKDRVFVAMEFVDGGTLGNWMHKRPSWREVLEVFARAGAGLAAAHRGGLVHRDFKPENVLMGTDGRVRVVDFGLARSVLDEEVEERSPRRQEELPELDSFNTPLTRTGAVMGTPAYMSPEQHLGRPATAQSDQFSFCVAMWEALYGERPFAGGSLAELTGNVLSATVREPPANVHVPRWIVGAIRQGLSRKPEDRFETMEALLSELRRDPRRKWRLGALGVVGVGVAVFLGIGTYQRLLTGDCDELVESMVGVWNGQRRDALTEAIAQGDVPWAAKVAESTATALDTYAEDWSRRVQDECLASQVGSDSTRATWTNKRLCFEDRRSGVEQLIGQLTEGGPQMATTALQAAVSLPDLAACQDPQRLAMWEIMGDPKAQERLAYARTRLVRAETAASLGQLQKAVESATAVIEDARELGVPALEAAGLLVRGLNRMRLTQNDPSVEQDLRLAIERAREAGDSATRAKALIQLGSVVGAEPSRIREAFEIGERADEAIQSLGSAPLLEARLQAMLGAAARRIDDWETSIEYGRKSLATLVELQGELHPDTLRTTNGLAISLCRNDQSVEAIAAMRRVVGVYETLGRASDPDVFTARMSLGVCLAREKRYDEALEEMSAALAEYRSDPSADDNRVLTAEYNIAFSYLKSGNFREALARARAGLPRAKKMLEARPKRLKDWHVLLGKSLIGTGSPEQAVGALQDALAILRESKASVLVIADLELKIAKATAEFDPARGLVLGEQLEGVLKRAPSGENRDKLKTELDSWLEGLRTPPDAPTPEDAG